MGSLKKVYPKNQKAHRSRDKAIKEIALMPPPITSFVLGNEDPIVSIHVPIQYRYFLNIGHEFVRNIIAMAYLQTYSKWELKIIDDPDGQLDLNDLLNEVEQLLGFKVNRTKISYIQSFNCNLGIKRNTLINMTSASIIVNWDDDDIYLKDYLKEAVEFFQLNPLQIGIFAGKRPQYNMATKQCVIWNRKICNGAAYYVIRKELFDKYPFIRYNTTRWAGEEQDVIKEIQRNINRAWSNQDTPSKGCDDNYIRLRYHGNLTHNDGQGWFHDVQIQQQYGGDFIKDKDLKWLLSRVPECLQDFYKDFVHKVNLNYGEIK